MSAGSIVISLLCATGQFETDTARAGKSLKKLQKDADDLSRSFKASFGGNLAAGFARDIIIGLGSIPGRFADMVKGSIDAADHLNDLSKKTGIAADTLGGIGFAAQQSGLDLDSVATAAGKLNKSLAEAAAGNKEAGEAFKVLGINVKDAAGQTKNADVVLAELADKFATYKDGPEKAALALRIFGKAGADIIPLLDEGGKSLQEQIAYFKRYSGVTVETAQKADAFNDTLTKINLLSGAFGKALTSELLGPLQGLANLFLENKEKGDQFRGVASDLVGVVKALAIGAAYGAVTFTTLGDQIGAMLAKAGALARLDFKGFSNIGKDADENLAAARKRFDDFIRAINGEGTADPSKPSPVPGVKSSAPRLSAPGGGADTAEAELKKKLDGLLRAIRNSADEQQSALAFANRFLEGEYQDGVVSLQNFFDDQANIRKRALQTQLEEQDKIIAAEEAFAKKSTNPASRIDAENKIADAVQKKRQLIVAAGQEEQLALQQNARDVLALQKAFEGVNAQVLDLGENFTAAAAIKFDLQFDALSKTFSANGNAAGLKAIDTLRAATIAQAAFQKASLTSGRTLDALSRSEERLALSVQTGSLTSLESLVKVGEERRKTIPIYEREVALLDAIARGPGGTIVDLEKAEAARLALDRLKASSDPLAESLNKTFGDDFNGALDDFVTGTKSAADAFKAFSKSVLNDILKMGSKSITESVFGGSGGIGGAISEFFSKNSGASTSGGLIGAFKGLGSAPSSGSAADDGTTAGIRGTIAALGGLSASAATASETISSQATAVSQNVEAFSGLGSAISATGDAFGSLVKDLASSVVDFVSSFASSSGGESSLSGLASLFSGFFADGGTIPPGKFGVVGERGPELLHMGSQSGYVIPNHAIRSSVDYGAFLRPIFDDGFRAPPTAASRDAESLAASFLVLKDKEKEPFAGYFAEGGYVPPNTWAVAGERGPEKIYGGKTGVSVQPGGKGGITNHNTYVTVQGQPGQPRDSLLNQGATLGLGIQKAMARNT